MTRKILRFKVQDAPVRPGALLARVGDDFRPVGGHVARDEILTPITTGKTLVLGRTWTGGLQSLVDSTLAAVEPLANGLASGNVLHAEGVPATLDLGRRWVGDLYQRIAAAKVDNGDVDLSEVAQELRQLSEQMSLTPGPAIGDAVSRLRQAVDAVKARTRTGDAHPMIRGYSRPHGNWGKATLPAELNAAARAHYARANRTRDVRTASGAPPSVADLNKANRAFWNR